MQKRAYIIYKVEFACISLHVFSQQSFQMLDIIEKSSLICVALCSQQWPGWKLSSLRRRHLTFLAVPLVRLINNVCERVANWSPFCQTQPAGEMSQHHFNFLWLHAAFQKNYCLMSISRWINSDRSLEWCLKVESTQKHQVLCIQIFNFNIFEPLAKSIHQ